MAFTTAQVRKLAGKLPERFVKTRTERGMTLSYVEGWHVIDEANRVFGFDGWDRETVSAECVWQDGRLSPKACSYAVRVRIKVRAGKTIVSREGTGIGHGSGPTLGEAHESALKEAETDATKRALITFGNLFGLALYDKERAGVQRDRAAGAPLVAWILLTGEAPPQVCETPQRFCSVAKDTLRRAPSAAALEALWTANAPTIAQLRMVQPELRTRNGTHYADLLETLFRQKRRALAASASERSITVEAAELPAAKAVPPTMHPRAALVPADLPVPIVLPSEPPSVVPLIGNATGGLAMPRRIRDGAHLKHVASLPCLVCGRTPSHPHHLRFPQLRSLGSKSSDEWAVPLCPIHHRSLHDAGREVEWWQAKGIDAKAEAERLWRKTHAPAAVAPALARSVEVKPVPSNSDDGGNRPSPAADTARPKTPPVDNQGQPFPVNLQAGSADRS